jgi:antitoxin VapB
MLWHMPNKKTQQTNQFERHVRLFRNGRNQAVRIPREFEMEGEEAIIHKEGDRLILEPVRKGKLLRLLATLEPIAESFPDIDESLPPLDDVEL